MKDKREGQGRGEGRRGEGERGEGKGGEGERGERRSQQTAGPPAPVVAGLRNCRLRRGIRRRLRAGDGGHDDVDAGCASFMFHCVSFNIIVVFMFIVDAGFASFIWEVSVRALNLNPKPSPYKPYKLLSLNLQP